MVRAQNGPSSVSDVFELSGDDFIMVVTISCLCSTSVSRSMKSSIVGLAGFKSCEAMAMHGGEYSGADILNMSSLKKPFPDNYGLKLKNILP